MNRCKLAIGMWVAVVLPGTAGAAADAWECQQGNIVRTVTLFYPQEPAPLPCKVYYGKSDEHQMPRVVWKAENVEGYCERKAASFVEKLETLGWNCAPEDAASAAGASAQ